MTECPEDKQPDWVTDTLNIYIESGILHVGDEEVVLTPTMFDYLEDLLSQARRYP